MTQLTVKIVNEQMVLISSKATVYCNTSNVQDMAPPSQLLEMRSEIISLAREKEIKVYFTQGMKKEIAAIGSQAVEEHSTYRDKFTNLKDYWAGLTKDGIVTNSDSEAFLSGYHMRDALSAMMRHSTALSKYLSIQKELIGIKRSLSNSRAPRAIAL